MQMKNIPNEKNLKKEKKKYSVSPLYPSAMSAISTPHQLDVLNIRFFFLVQPWYLELLGGDLSVLAFSP